VYVFYREEEPDYTPTTATARVLKSGCTPTIATVKVLKSGCTPIAATVAMIDAIFGYLEFVASPHVHLKS
jgi:hypothetical protein